MHSLFNPFAFGKVNPACFGNKERIVYHFDKHKRVYHSLSYSKELLLLNSHRSKYRFTSIVVPVLQIPLLATSCNSFN